MTRFMKRLGEVWRCAGLYRMKEYEPLGIGMYQDAYLINICEKPGMTQEEISERIYVHKSNVARQLSVLEERGYVRRETDAEDRRIQRVYPTEKAYEVLPQIRAVHRAWNERVLAGMSEQEREAVSRLAERLAENAKRVLSEEEGRR